MNELTQVRKSLMAIAEMLEQSIPSNQIAKIKIELEKLNAFDKNEPAKEEPVPQVHTDV